MSRYLEQLRTLLHEKRLPDEPSKPSQGGFEGFEGDMGSRFFSDEAIECGTAGSLGTGRTVSAEAAERIRAYPCPDGLGPSRWLCLQDGAARFTEGWGERALALGWDDAELFALADPFARGDLQGAAWFVGSSTVVAVTPDAITLRTESGATLRIYRRARSARRD